MQCERIRPACALLVRTMNIAATVIPLEMLEREGVTVHGNGAVNYGNDVNEAILSAIFASWTEAIYCTIHGEASFGRCAEQQELIPGVQCPRCRKGTIIREHGSFCDGRCHACGVTFEEKSHAVRPGECVSLRGGEYSNFSNLEEHQHPFLVVTGMIGHAPVSVAPWLWRAERRRDGKSNLTFNLENGRTFLALRAMVRTLSRLPDTDRDRICRAIAVCVRACRDVRAPNKDAAYNQDAPRRWWR